MAVSLLDRFQEREWRFFRAGMFVALGLYGLVPVLHQVRVWGGGRGGTLLYCTSSHQVFMCVCGSGAGGGGATCACALTWPICLALIKQQKVGSSPFFHLSLPPPLHADGAQPRCAPGPAGPRHRPHHGGNLYRELPAACHRARLAVSPLIPPYYCRRAALRRCLPRIQPAATTYVVMFYAQQSPCIPSSMPSSLLPVSSLPPLSA